MKQVARQFLVASSISLCCLVSSSPARAQISSDGTLSTNVSKSGNVFEITGGAQAGGNLFHSFAEFSVPTDNTAFFNNASNIANIISRVTGGSISNIDGLIRANGSANLILINPSGINFGPNAQLNIGGSFLGSTASSLAFADGTVFSATNPQNPMLTISVPLGLQFGQNAAPVEVRGSNLEVEAGQTLALVGGDVMLLGGNLTAPGGRIELGSVAGKGLVSLNQTNPGWVLGYEEVQNFRDIQFTRQSLVNASGNGGGEIQVQGRRVSVQDGSQILSFTLGSEPGGNFTVRASESVEVRGNSADGLIPSSLQSNTLGTGTGSDVTIETGKLIVSDGAFVSAATAGAGKGGNLTVRASESVELIGTGFEEFQQTFQGGTLRGTISPTDRATGLFIGTAAAGRSGNITIEAPSLLLRDGSVILSPTFSNGVGGDITIRASESVEVSGSALQSGTALGSTKEAEAGDIKVDTKRLIVRDGGIVIDATFGNGPGGNIEITASDSIELLRTPPETQFLVTGIYTGTVGGMGKGGDIKIETGQLIVREAAVGSNSGVLLPSGEAIPLGGVGGDVVIEARELVELSGSFITGLGSSTLSQSPAGDLTLSTRKLTIGEQASISSSTIGLGSGGNLTVKASESIELIGISAGDQTPGGLFADSGRIGNLPNPEVTADSGNIRIDTGELIVRDGASINVQNLGSGNAGTLEVAADSILLDNQGAINAATVSGQGGEIILEVDSLVMRRNSQISATAGGTGNGGNITVTGLSPAEFADSAVLLESSTIAANAFQGRGGNIQIDTRVHRTDWHLARRSDSWGLVCGSD